jgi:hypothetical protein
MGNPQVFDYNQPSRDTLAGIYVEWDDEDGGESPSRVMSEAQSLALFGLTLTVDDRANSKQSAPPPSRESASPS